MASHRFGLLTLLQILLIGASEGIAAEAPLSPGEQAVLRCSELNDNDECLGNAFVALSQALEAQLPKESYRCWATSREEGCGDHEERAMPFGAFFGRRWQNCQHAFELRLEAILSSFGAGAKPSSEVQELLREALQIDSLDRLLTSLKASDQNPCEPAAGF